MRALPTFTLFGRIGTVLPVCAVSDLNCLATSPATLPYVYRRLTPNLELTSLLDWLTVSPWNPPVFAGSGIELRTSGLHSKRATQSALATLAIGESHAIETVQQQLRKFIATERGHHSCLGHNLYQPLKRSQHLLSHPPHWPHPPCSSWMASLIQVTP